MMFPDLGVGIAIAFACSLLVMQQWIRRCKKHGLVIHDVQKYPPREVAYLAGIPVVFSAVIGILFVVAAQTFLFENEAHNSLLLAATCTLLIALIIGTVDDLLGERIGLRKHHKVVLTALAALPMAVVNAGHHVMTFPFVGQVALGNVYAFLVIPLGIIGATNGFNILAGLNGLEAGMGAVMLATLGFLSWQKGSMACVVAFCLLAAVLAFYRFNRFPARILPGNGFTYAIGAGLAVVAIMGDLERPALLLFIPYFVELALKSRGGLRKESLARPRKDHSLVNKYQKWYSVNHVAISALRKVRGKAWEREASCFLIGVEALIAAAILLWS